MEVGFQTCCRLCLDDKQQTLKSIFDEAFNDKDLPGRIRQFLAVEIAQNDKLTVMVCDDCVAKLDSWHVYKGQCLQNQTKLAEWLRNTIPDVTIKSEPMEEPEIADLHVTSQMFSVKMEIPDGTSMEEEYSDLPPPLTPHSAEEYNFSEESQESQISQSEIADDAKRCKLCNKMFSSVGNRRRHDFHMHKIQQTKRTPMHQRQSIQTSSNNSTEIFKDDSSSTQESAPSGGGDEKLDEEDQQKIKFAAGLKLYQKDSTPVELESLSKIEQSYIEKCKAMVSMYHTLQCACHNVQHLNLRGLLSHLRSTRIWFPLFTCYHCMISFTDRSTFTRHHVKCPRKQLETLLRLSNLRKRTEVKTRLYQNFQCTRCKFMFSFHEDFCRHVDEEHAVDDPPFYCSCRQVFDSSDDFKTHAYSQCMVAFYCDICFMTTDSIEHFQKHAQEIHDNSEGFVLLQEDKYVKRKAVSHVRESADESLVVTGKRERRQSIKTPILIPVLETDDQLTKQIPTKTLINKVMPHANTKNIKGPAKCPICKKDYSSTYNMIRHYRTHLENSDLIPKETDQDSSFYSCPDCGGMYSSSNWVKHIEDFHQPQTCTECDKVFQFQTELEQHRSVHLNLILYRDSETQSYKSTMISPEDEDNQLNEVMLMCEICDTMFSSKEELKLHKLTHDSASESSMLSVNGEEEIKVEPGEKFQCQDCDREYCSYKSLREHCKQKHGSYAGRQSDYPKKCDYCDKVCTTGAAYFLHKQTHERVMLSDLKRSKQPPERRRSSSEPPEEESYHTCKRCFKVFSSKYNLKSHMRCHGLSPAKKLSRKLACNFCQMVFESTEELDEHKIASHSENNDGMPELTNEVDDEDDKIPIVFTCDVCVMTFSTKASLKKHKETHKREVINPIVPKNKNTLVYCKYCKIAFNGVMDLTRHMHVEHGETAKPKVERSEEKQLNSKPYKCPICRKGFHTVGAMNAHAGWHKRSSGSKIAKHLKIVKKIADTAAPKPSVGPPPEFQCSTCLAELPNDTALQIHILEKHRSVDAVMLIPRCNDCSQDFATQEEYELHKRFHDFLERQKKHDKEVQQQQQQAPKPKNHPCNYCKSVFSRSDTLNTHMKHYHKEYVPTEFRCTQCDRVFDKQNSLSIHLKVHEKQNAMTGTKSFSCSICSMKFKLPKDLRMHTINAHPF